MQCVDSPEPSAGDETDLDEVTGLPHLLDPEVTPVGSERTPNPLWGRCDDECRRNASFTPNGPETYSHKTSLCDGKGRREVGPEVRRGVTTQTRILLVRRGPGLRRRVTRRTEEDRLPGGTSVRPVVTQGQGPDTSTTSTSSPQDSGRDPHVTPTSLKTTESRLEEGTDHLSHDSGRVSTTLFDEPPVVTVVVGARTGTTK